MSSFCDEDSLQCGFCIVYVSADAGRCDHHQNTARPQTYLCRLYDSTFHHWISAVLVTFICVVLLVVQLKSSMSNDQSAACISAIHPTLSVCYQTECESRLFKPIFCCTIWNGPPGSQGQCGHCCTIQRCLFLDSMQETWSLRCGKSTGDGVSHVWSLDTRMWYILYHGKVVVRLVEDTLGYGPYRKNWKSDCLWCWLNVFERYFRVGFYIWIKASLSLKTEKCFLLYIFDVSRRNG